MAEHMDLSTLKLHAPGHEGLPDEPVDGYKMNWLQASFFRGDGPIITLRTSIYHVDSDAEETLILHLGEGRYDGDRLVDTWLCYDTVLYPDVQESTLWHLADRWADWTSLIGHRQLNDPERGGPGMWTDPVALINVLRRTSDQRLKKAHFVLHNEQRMKLGLNDLAEIVSCKIGESG